MIIIFAIVFAVWGFFIFCFILNATNPTPTWKQGKEGYKDLKEKNSILQQKAKQLDIEEKEIDNLRSEILVLENTKKCWSQRKKRY